MDQLRPPESKKYKPFELNPNATSEEILLQVDGYIEEIGEIITPINREFDSRNEFQTARKSPDRKKAISDFKKNLKNQMEGMASCRTLIESVLAQNPNVDSNVLLDILYKFAKTYGISGRELQNYEQTIRNLIKVITRTNILRKEFPNDLDLLNSMLEPKNKFDSTVDFKIKATPFGFVVHLKGSDAKKFDPNSDNNTGGFSGEAIFKLERKDDSGNNIRVRCPVAFVITDSKFITQNEMTPDQIELHELEHIKTGLISETDNKKDLAFNIDALCGRYGISQYLKNIKYEETEIQEYRDLINENPAREEQYLKKIRICEEKISEYKEKIIEKEQELILEIKKYCLETNYDMYRYVLNEFISRKKDKANHDLYRLINSDSYFDYFNQILEIVKTYLPHNQDLLNKISSLRDKYKEMFINEALNASDSFDRLVKEGGYSTDEAISLLTDTPLQIWSKKIDRILKS